MNLLNSFWTIARILVILGLSTGIVACDSSGVLITKIQTEGVKADNTDREISPTSAEQINQSLPDKRVLVDADFEVRPIGEIFASEPPKLVDITASEATLIFKSSIPLACSIVYGKTTDYGMLTLDQDMNGGVHTDHHPFILNLEPDTVYHYRLQGSAEDGTIYMSEDMIFRTPLADSAAEINLASLAAGAHIITVSSNYGGSANEETWGANSALDNSRSTAWSSEGDGNHAFIEIQLAQRSQLDAIEVWTRSMSNNTAQIFEFTVTTDSGEVLGPFALPNAEQAYRFAVDVAASTLRFDVVDSNGGNTGLVEFAAYGTPLEMRDQQDGSKTDNATVPDAKDPDDDMN